MIARWVALLWIGWLAAAPGTSMAEDAPAPPGIQTERSAVLWTEGRRALIDLRVQDAEAVLYRLAERPDGAAAAYHSLATLSLLQGLLSESPADLERMKGRLDTLAVHLEALSDARWRETMEGEAALMQALAALRTGAYLNGAWRARSAIRTLQDVTDAHPDFAAPQFGLGLLHVAVGSLPRAYRGLLRIVGVRGSVEEGRSYLQAAADRSALNGPFATIVRALLDVQLDRAPQAAVDRLADLHAATGEPPFVANFYGFALLENRQADAAARVLQAAVEEQAQEGRFPVDYLYAFLGAARYLQGDWSAAEAALRTYLERHPGQSLRAPATMDLALTIELSRSWAEARPYYRQVSDTRNFDADKAAQRRAAERAEAPMTAVERELLMGRRAYDAGHDRKALRILRDVQAREGLSDDDAAEAAYRLGRVHQALGNDAMALAAYAEAVHRRGDRQAKWAPFSLFYTAQIHAAAGRPDAARRATQAARTWPRPYDYDDAIERWTGG